MVKYGKWLSSEENQLECKFLSFYQINFSCQTQIHHSHAKNKFNKMREFFAPDIYKLQANESKTTV